MGWATLLIFRCMKPILCIFPFVLFACALSAQIPNGDFETWTDEGDYHTPTGWRSSNESSGSLPGGVAVMPDLAAHTGNLAAMVRTVSVGVTGELYAGVLTNGSLDTLSKHGEPITYKPAKITGYYKYTAAPNDSAILYLYMNRFSSVLNDEELVAGASVVLGAANTWTYFESDVQDAFASAPAPESYVIVAASTLNTTQPKLSTLILDDIAFSGVSSVNDPALDAKLNVYPNPANHQLVVEIAGEYLNELILTNAAGVQVKHLYPKVADKTVVATAQLPAGAYVLSLVLQTGDVVHRSVQIIR